LEIAQKNEELYNNELIEKKVPQMSTSDQNNDQNNSLNFNNYTITTFNNPSGKK
jgi:hypothetical protein